MLNLTFMKNLIIISILATVLFSCTGNKSKETKSENESVAEQVMEDVSNTDLTVYYFHYTHRCATCNAVENVAKKAVETNFIEDFKSGKIAFESYNLDEPKGEVVAEKLGVNGQALLIVKGEEQIDLTNEGFTNARHNSEEFMKIVTDSVNKML